MNLPKNPSPPKKNTTVLMKNSERDCVNQLFLKVNEITTAENRILRNVRRMKQPDQSSVRAVRCS